MGAGNSRDYTIDPDDVPYKFDKNSKKRNKAQIEYNISQDLSNRKRDNSRNISYDVAYNVELPQKRIAEPLSRKGGAIIQPDKNMWKPAKNGDKDYEIDYSKIIGEGSFGKVYKGRNKITGNFFAVKIINKKSIRGPGSEALLELIRTESLILQSLNHPNIVKIYYTHETEDYIYIFLDYYPGGDLFEYLNQFKYINECMAYIIMNQVFKGVFYLHSNSIVHRDIKLENFLYDSSEKMNVVISDFGFAIRREINDPLLEDYPGSPYYAAPELQTGTPYTGFPVDIWALGVSLYILVVGNYPFDGGDLGKIKEQVIAKRVIYPSRLTPECIDLLGKMLNRNPDTRITISEILVHPWMEKCFSRSKTCVIDSPKKENTQNIEVSSPSLIEPLTNGIGLRSMIKSMAALATIGSPKLKQLSSPRISIAGSPSILSSIELNSSSPNNTTIVEPNYLNTERIELSPISNQNLPDIETKIPPIEPRYIVSDFIGSQNFINPFAR